MILPVIMSGGNGSRLWPLSRKQHPKQFLSLIGESTMLQETILRLKGLETLAPSIICNKGHRFIVAEQLNEIDALGGDILLEPQGRNTAPAVALAAIKAIEKGSDPLLLVLAADHVITDINAFHEAIKQAQVCAETGRLVTFGIVPDKPETGYGYIRSGKKIKGSDCLLVEEFVEKPNLKTATTYVESGEYFWNSGMFLFKASTYIQELEKHQPEILTACKAAIQNAVIDSEFIRVDAETFLTCPDDSIDYAIMERTQHAAMVPLNAGWSDVGSWSSIWEVKEKDENQNVKRGDVKSIDTKNCLIDARDKLVATIGVSDLVVVETSDAVLIADISRVQDVKKVVEQLNREERLESVQHRTVYRPWGHINLLQRGERYKSKQVTIKPHARLSLQMHYHRAEHWIVVSGTAKVRCDDKESLITENQSTYIPIGAVHSIENPGSIPLVMIEVQTGSYIAKDDIVRLEDLYGFDKD
ncbi:mannose-1-phosphate guanylyltransferase/mannose-6-phosphate isomerase [Pseudoalteromonas sp. 1CM17D]|uniref:mannose-1-phosphate guanylyltransferase/mannose-6-phosphate isomerase n=1 Tax=Pseudoalteromonas sp. 1CM17D TaxID=2929162 RepID=UPI0020C153F9|nr:mannose-1-phosphate guanylyltransferase/mannose-6-phosphate isomerase [Pseudoalteromonas sp. 1CM17D]MCK8097416.1 mannose-1-phosphate guanylyltransferase/mannose-6-phosphate isomerase [Pseudoalteromonas sp. 1CM17D]